MVSGTNNMQTPKNRYQTTRSDILHHTSFYIYIISQWRLLYTVKLKKKMVLKLVSQKGRGVRGLDLNISQIERFCFEYAILNVIYDLKFI
jgi:hypothetical protein